MKAYATKDIRNVGIVGHGGTGKTQLVSSLLFTAGATQRLGKVAEGSSTTDWDEEEIGRKMSIQTGLAYAEWATPGRGDKVKINLIDLPGSITFINETKASLVAADAALIVIDAHSGAQVTTERVWDYCTEFDIPRAFVLNWMDRELSSFRRSMESLHDVFGRSAVAVQLPIGEEKDFHGVVDLVAMKANLYKPGGDGKPSIEEIPADLAADRKSTRLNSSHVKISYAVFCLKKKTGRKLPRSGHRAGARGSPAEDRRTPSCGPRPEAARRRPGDGSRRAAWARRAAGRSIRRP